jgi:hypothetical protein
LIYNHRYIANQPKEVIFREEMRLFSKSNRIHFFNTPVQAGQTQNFPMSEILLPLRCVIEVHPEWYLAFVFARIEFIGAGGRPLVKQIITDISKPGLKVDTSGRDLEYARWILENTDESLVPSEHNIMVKVHYPSHWDRLDARFHIEAKFKRKGWQKLLPIFGSGEVRISDHFNLLQSLEAQPA